MITVHVFVCGCLTDVVCCDYLYYHLVQANKTNTCCTSMMVEAVATKRDHVERVYILIEVG